MLPMENEIDVKKTVEDLLGHCGRMIAGSKSGYRKAFPKNFVLFNANIVLEGWGKVWYGDLDLTRDEALLVRLAELTKRELYVLHETDARFENEANPLISKAYYKVSRIPFLSWHMFLGESKTEWYVRHRRSGILQAKPTPRKTKKDPARGN